MTLYRIMKFKMRIVLELDKNTTIFRLIHFRVFSLYRQKAEKFFFAALFYLTLCLGLPYGCGGSEESTGLNESSIQDFESGYSLHLALVRVSDASATTTLSASEPGELVITLKALDQPVGGELINIVTNLGSLLPATDSGAGTALTDEAGMAKIRLITAGEAGAGTVTVSTRIDNTTTLSTSLNFSIIETQQEITENIQINLRFENAVTNNASIRGDAPGLLIATLSSQDGEPLSNTILTVSSDIIQLNPASGRILTNDNGEASIELAVGSETGVSSVIVETEIAKEVYSASQNITVEPPALKLGSGEGENFSAGALDSISDSISAGGTTNLTLSVVTEDNSLFTPPVTLQLTSPCIEEGKATIDSTVTTRDGQASVTYRAQGCEGTDRITATLDFGGATFSATKDLTVISDDAGSINFISAAPNTIVLQGSGGQGLLETSEVTFQVMGTQGLPAANQVVNFSLSTDVGGISMEPPTAISDGSGYVSTSVQSGTIASSVVVVATLDNREINTQSSSLVISTGVPDQDSISISASPTNPEALQHFGITSSITAYAADHFNNPVPDGVSLFFTTEGGQVSPNCQTMEGSCTVTWTSQLPIPENGRITIMVSTIGAESFADENGNGVFDEGDILNDISEPYRDDNENNTRDSSEPYVDFNANGVFDLPDGLFAGHFCEHASLCSLKKSASVSSSRVISSSGSRMEVVFTASHEIYEPGFFVDALISDVNGNSLPCATLVEVNTSNAENQSEKTSWEVACNTLAPLSIRVYPVPDIGIEDTQIRIVDGERRGTARINLQAETPLGIESGGSFEFLYPIPDPIEDTAE